MKQFSVTELDNYLRQGNGAMLIDVRETHELAHGMIEGAMHIPMNDVPGKLNVLEKNKNDTIVLICRSGKRSAQVGQFLEHMGFTDIINLDGGMNAWATEIDTSMSVY